MNRIFALFVVVGIASVDVHAQMALALTLADQDVRHRDVAGGLVSRLAEHWQFVHPPLAADELALCRADTACLLKLAESRGASHLLLLGVAGLGARDVVVTARVVAKNGAVVADETAVVVGSANAAVDGHAVADTLIAGISGVPAPTPRPERQAVVEEGGALGVVGVVLVAAGVVVSGAALGVAFVNAADANRRDLAAMSAIGGGALGVAAATVGAGIVIADAQGR